MKRGLNKKILFASASIGLALAAPAGIAGAKPAYAGGASVHAAQYAPSYDPIDAQFRLHHPFRVFIDVSENRNQTRRHRKRGAHSIADEALRANVAAYLPPYVQLVPNRNEADMVIRAQELDRQLTFRITDEDQRRKKYKKRRRYVGGQCGQFNRAFYSRIKEQGIERTDYRLTVRLKGQGRYSDTVHIESRESYRYGANLRASTNCGVIPTRHFPNSAVAELFSRNPKTYRPLIAREVARETAGKLAHIVSDVVAARSEQFYTNLAAHLNNEGRYYASGYGEYYDYEPHQPRYPRRRR